jgi:hypothetical protein
MRFLCLVSLFLAGLLCRQAALSAVGPEDPVIILDDFCAGAAQSADAARPGSACRTVVTRAQFEKLIEALQPGMSQSLRLSVANAFARNLRMSAAAEDRGLDKTPAFEEEMHFARMQLLAQDLNRALHEEADHITDAELEEYYRKHESSYEQATVARIFVPHAKQIPRASEQGADTRAPQGQSDARSVEAMTEVAADLRTRAANGEDPDQLQIEAYAEAGSPRTSANTKIEKLRRAMLPPAHETVLDLKPGEVSEVFSDPAGAHFIYKMMAKQTLTLSEAATEIRASISSSRYRDSTKAFQGNVVFNDAYFNPPNKTKVPGTTH